MLHFRLDLFKSANVGVRRALMEPRSQLVQLFGSADSVSFHAAVIEIAHPTRDADGAGVLFHKPAESDSLNTAGNQPAARRFQ